MPQSTRKIKKQIQSIGNIRKITKAMELVSTVKMKKATASVVAARPYANLAWQMVLNLAARSGEEFHPLLQPREKINRLGVVLISSNRGLCGVFNQQIVREALRYVAGEKGKSQPQAVEFITLGRKGAAASVKAGQNVVADFDKADIVTEVAAVRAVSQLVIKDYLAGKYDQVVVAYTDFISFLRQKPQVKQLMPLVTEWQLGLGEVEEKKPKTVIAEIAPWHYEYLFEPSAGAVLDQFLPRLIELQSYQAILESNASEHSARMMAMKNSSEAASDLISDLTLAFNKVRQAGITQELTEITLSKAALEE